MRIANIQLEVKEREKTETLDHVLQLIDRAQGCDLILLPEIWPIGYFAFARYAADAEPLDGPILRTLRQKAVDLNLHILAGSIIEKNGRELYNTAGLIDPEGNLIATYRKIHLFGYKSEEARLLTRGHAVVVAETPWGRAGISTCYDLRFPELFRKMQEQGAEMFLVVSAWPAARVSAWRLFNRARAHENLAWLVSCNAAGESAGTQLAGHSMVVDPSGEVVAEAGESEEILTADIDMEKVRELRAEFPVLHDRLLI